MNENIIEWVDGDETISVTFHQKKWVNRVKRLAVNSANKITILSENPDGSIFAHLPIKCLNLHQLRADNIDTEKKSEMAERLKKYRFQRRNY